MLISRLSSLPSAIKEDSLALRESLASAKLAVQLREIDHGDAFCRYPAPHCSLRDTDLRFGFAMWTTSFGVADVPNNATKINPQPSPVLRKSIMAPKPMKNLEQC